MNQKNKSARIKLPVPTSEGQFIAHYSEKGLAELNFPRVGSPRRADRTPQHGGPAQIRRWHRTTSDALKKILGGREPKRCHTTK